jgi:tripartite-type tricarboxylate transporter receptor subunit TctC
MILKKKVGIDLVPVPYKGSAPATMALLSGSVDMTIVDDLIAMVHADKLRFLAIISEERYRKFPEVPTFKELGYEAPLGYAILGISGPPGLPEEIQKILSDALTKAIKNPEFVSKLDKMGPTPIYISGPEFRAETQRFYKLVEEYKDILME